MDYEKMSLDELKTYAKSIGLSFSNIGKEKLIARIKEKEAENKNIQSVLADEDLENNTADPSGNPPENVNEESASSSLLDSISSAIDDLEDSTDGEVDEIVELPNSHIVRVKSITFGGLTYKSRATGSVFRWNQIGAVQDMTVAELNEMNNYRAEFLRKPLVILMDEQAVKKFRLTPVYENVAKINNLTSVFNSDMQTIEKVIDDALRVNMRDILISKVRQMYKTKKLVNIDVLRLLQDKLKFDILEDNI